MNRAKLIFLCAFVVVLVAAGSISRAWAWGNQGHEIVAIIAADNLSPSARDQVGRILGAPRIQALWKKRWPPRQYGLTLNSERKTARLPLALHRHLSAGPAD